jgi:hypothetical protein
MPYDEDLANRIRELIADDPDVTEKRVHAGPARSTSSPAASGSSSARAIRPSVERRVLRVPASSRSIVEGASSARVARRT